MCSLVIGNQRFSGGLPFIVKRKKKMTAFVAIEPRIAIACAGIAVAIFLPAWGSMHHSGESFELWLTIAGWVNRIDGVRLL